MTNISKAPQLAPMFRGKVQIKGIGKTRADCFAMVGQEIRRIPKGTVLAEAISTGMEYLVGYGFLAARLQIVESREEAIFRA